MKNPPQDHNIHKVFPTFSFAKKCQAKDKIIVLNEHAKYRTFNSDERNKNNLIRSARKGGLRLLISNSQKSLSGTLTSDPLTL